MAYPGPPKWWSFEKQKWLYDIWEWLFVGGLSSQTLEQTNATDGYVLTADGEGGSAWEVIPTYAYKTANDIYDNNAAAAVTPVSDIVTPFDGNVLNQVEDVGVPGMDLSVNFTGVTSIQGLVLRAYYDGSSSHHVDVSFYNYNTTAEDIVIRLDDTTDHNYRTIFIPDDSDYISGGAAQVNFIHPDTGNQTHDLYIDYVAIIESVDPVTSAACRVKCIKTDYGAVGGGVVDDTPAFQAAADDGPNLLIRVPTDSYLVTSTISQTKQSLFWEGDGGINSEILFNPSAADICFHVHNSGSVYFHGGFKGLFFNSDDTTYAKTAIKLEDTSGIRLEQLMCHGDSFSTGWSDSGYDSIFLHTTGREFLTSQHLYLSADIGILIDQNPNTLRTEVLDADHFRFQDTFITTTNGSDSPCVRVADGVNLADMTFDGQNPWVRPGGHGFEWIDTATDNIASHNLRFHGVGYEQAGDATKYSFYIDKSGTNTLQNLTIENGGTATEPNGIYLRNVLRATFINTNMLSQSGKIALNVDSTCHDIRSINCYWNENATATTTGMEMMFGLLKTATASPLPQNFHLIKSQATTWQQNGIHIFSARKWSWAGELADNASYDTACSPGNFMDAGILTVWVYESTPIQEGGIFGIDPTGVTILSSTANVTTTLGTASNLNVGLSSSVVTVENKLGATVHVVISADYKV